MQSLGLARRRTAELPPPDNLGIGRKRTVDDARASPQTGVRFTVGMTMASIRVQRLIHNLISVCTLAAAGAALAAFATATASEVSLYSYREPQRIEPLLRAFHAATGILVKTTFAREGSELCWTHRRDWTRQETAADRRRWSGSDRAPTTRVVAGSRVLIGCRFGRAFPCRTPLVLNLTRGLETAKRTRR